MSLSRHEHFRFRLSWTFLNILANAENTIDNVAIYRLVLVLSNSNRKSTLSNFIEISFVYIIAGLVGIA